MIPNLGNHHIPQRHSAFVLEEFDDEVLLYAITDTRAVYLNETAHLIWLLCEQQRTVGEIIEMLEASFPEAKGAISTDVRAVLHRFLELGAVVLAGV